MPLPLLRLATRSGDHLAVAVNLAPQFASLATDADARFVNVPFETVTPQMFFDPLGQLRPQLLHPAIKSRAINRNASLGQNTYNVLIS